VLKKYGDRPGREPRCDDLWHLIISQHGIWGGTVPAARAALRRQLAEWHASASLDERAVS
jgi:hypothetical protein